MERQAIHKLLRPHLRPSAWRVTWQILNTLIPYLGSIVLMYYMLQWGVPTLLILLLAIVPGMLLVRLFIFFHDCTHGSFLRSKRWMSFWGHVFGVLTFTPYYKWQREHITHHRTVGNIDKRGIGDVWTMTVAEYERASWQTRLGYRLYRHPLILFGIGPMYLFLIHERLPLHLKTKKEWFSVLFTNVALVAIALTVTWTVGFQYYLLIQLPILYVAATMGVWIFFVQHQYDDVYWEQEDDWDIVDAAMKGSSIYRLPAVLEWATGAIGYHNLHHLSAKIPNYRLKRAFLSHPFFQEGRTITFWRSLRLGALMLYEEQSHRLLSYRQYKRHRRAMVG
jgi:omega-6 fatty acid desaturase (delta-12 desaturase)